MVKHFLTTVLILLTGAATAFAGQKLAPELSNAMPGNTAQVIVVWKHVPDATQHGKVTQRGGELRRAFSYIPAGAYSVPAQNLHDLANDPDVVYIAPDRPVKGMLDYSAAAVNAPAVWSQGYTGAGITVAVIDSGLNSSPDLNDNQVILKARISPANTR